MRKAGVMELPLNITDIYINIVCPVFDASGDCFGWTKAWNMIVMRYSI